MLETLLNAPKGELLIVMAFAAGFMLLFLALMYFRIHVYIRIINLFKEAFRPHTLKSPHTSEFARVPTKKYQLKIALITGLGSIICFYFWYVSDILGWGLFAIVFGVTCITSLSLASLSSDQLVKYFDTKHQLSKRGAAFVVIGIIAILAIGQIILTSNNISFINTLGSIAAPISIVSFFWHLYQRDKVTSIK